MLDSLRRSTGSWVVKALFALLVASFALWGAGDFLNQQVASRSAISFTDCPIEVQADALYTDWDRTRQALREQTGLLVTADHAMAPVLLDRVVNNRLAQAALDCLAADNGIVASNAAVRRSLLAMPGVRTADGGIDTNMLARIANSNPEFRSVDRLIDGTRRFLQRSALVDALNVWAEAPDVLVRTLHTFRAEQRVVETLTIPTDGIAVDDSPAESDLADIHTANEARFTAPVYREIAAVVLDIDVVVDEIAVSEAELERTYQQFRDRFAGDERRFVLRISADDEAEAGAVMAALSDGRAFRSVAADVAGQAAEVTELGWTTRDALPPQIADVVFSAAAGEVVGPLETPLGPMILQVTEIDAEAVQALEDVRDEVARLARQDRAPEVLYQLSADFEDALGGGASLSEAAAAVGATLRTVTTDRTGLDPDENPVDLPAPVIRAAFSLSEGEESPLEEFEEGYYLVRVDGVIEPRLRPLDEVRAQVVELWRQERRTEIAGERAAGLADRARAGASLADLASEEGLDHETSPPFTRGAAADLPADLVDEIFAASLGGVLTASSPAGHAVVRLTDIRPPDPAASSGERERIARELAGVMTDDLLQVMGNQLAGRYGAQVNESSIQALLNVGGDTHSGM